MNWTLSTKLVTLTLAPLAIAAGCGGEVELGTLAATDGGTPGTTGCVMCDAAPLPQPEGGVPSGVPVVCPSAEAAATGIYDLAANGEGDITDFFGDGERVWVGANYTANFQNGHIITIPELSPTQRQIVNVSPSRVARIGPALDRVFFGVVPETGKAEFAVVPRTGGPKQQQELTSVPLFASHRDRNDAVYVASTGAPTRDVVWRWDPPAAATSEIVFSAEERVRSLAMNATTWVALIENTSGLVPSYKIVRKPSQPGGGVYQTIASTGGDFVSNVALDDTSAFVATFDQASLVFTVHRAPLTASGLTLGASTSMGGFTGSDTFERAQLVVDESHAYVSHGPAAACGGTGFCSAPVTVVRFDKQATKPSAPAKVTEFTGPALDEIAFRAFNVDACYMYWHDASKRMLMRQAKVGAL